MDWVDKPQNYKDLYGILQLLRFSHLNNFQLKTLKLGWVAFHSVMLDFQSNQYKKLVPVLSRFCNGLLPVAISTIPGSQSEGTCFKKGKCFLVKNLQDQIISPWPVVRRLDNAIHASDKSLFSG